MMLGANVAYKYDLADNMVLVPSAGLNVMRMTVNDYVEEGSDLQNMEYKTKDFNSVSGRVGFDLIGEVESSSSMKIKPNAHANLSYDFTGKLPEVRTSFVGSSVALPTSSTKPARLSGDLGVGVTLSNEKVEFSIDYNAKLSRKYIGHEGSLKVRFNF